MSTLAATIHLLIDGSFTKSLDLTSPKEVIGISKSNAFANGTGSNQGNEFFSDSRQLIETSETIDLTSTLTNAFGETVTFIKVRAFILHVTTKTTGFSLILSGNFLTNAGWITGTTPTQIVGPDGLYVVTNPVDGYTVTNTTQDQLTIDSGSNTVDYDLIIIGTT